MSKPSRIEPILQWKHIFEENRIQVEADFLTPFFLHIHPKVKYYAKGKSVRRKAKVKRYHTILTEGSIISFILLSLSFNIFQDFHFIYFFYSFYYDKYDNKRIDRYMDKGRVAVILKKEMDASCFLVLVKTNYNISRDDALVGTDI